MKTHKDTIALSLLTLFFLMGWLFTAPIFTNHSDLYLILNIIALISSASIIRDLIKNAVIHLSLLVIFLIYLVGYLAKYYLLCFISENSIEFGEFLANSYPREYLLLNDESLLIQYFQLITIALLCFATLVRLLSSPSKNFLAIQGVPQQLIHYQPINRGLITKFFASTLVASVVVFALMQIYNIGLPSYENNSSAPLPFHLAGIIYSIQSSFLPLFFLALICITENYRNSNLNKYIVAAYMCFGILAGIITTSKASVISMFVSLITLWFLMGRITPNRILLIAAAFPLITIFNILIGVMRNIYWSSPDLGLFDALLAGQDQLENSDQKVNLPAWFNFASPFLRIGGFDSLLSILAYYQYDPSPDMSNDILFGSGLSAAEFYTNIILEWSAGSGTMFSPSLLGFFYIANQSILSVCLAFLFYSMLWYLIFDKIRRLNLAVGPAVLSLLVIQLAFYTSEGNLESIPQKLLHLLFFGFVSEWLVHKLANKPQEE